MLHASPLPFKRQPHKKVKNTQTIRWLLLTNCLSVFDHFVGLALEKMANYRTEAFDSLQLDPMATSLVSFSSCIISVKIVFPKRR